MAGPDTAIAARLRAVRARIEAAAHAAGRDPAAVTLVAVSKTVPAEAVRAAIEAGQRAFGENYAQELRDKAASAPGAEWHFVGRLQRNKARQVVGLAHLIHAVDSDALARELDRRAAAADLVQDVLVQVNVAGEASKAGVAPAEAPALVEACRGLAHLRCRGLMTMPPYAENPEASRPAFAALARLARDLGLADLSMGMSHDLEVAVQEGATIVRVGTAIFGERRGGTGRTHGPSPSA